MKTITIKKNQIQTFFKNTLEESTIVLEQGAHLTYILSVHTGTQKMTKLVFKLEGEGARLEMIGLMAGNKENQLNLQTETHFNADNTYGHIKIKAIMTDQAQTEYLGLIRIPHGVHDIDGFMGHHTLLLSKKARAKSVPSLEIEANQVTCGHSASIGQISDEALFYLTSRGLSENQAKTLLIEAFFEELISKIEDSTQADRLRKKLFKTVRHKKTLTYIP